MNQIVKAETAPTMSQATASASVLVALIVALAALGEGVTLFRCFLAPSDTRRTSSLPPV